MTDETVQKQIARIDNERALLYWGVNNRQRDILIRNAYELGTSKQRIHQLSGISRSTIDHILDKETSE